MALYYNGDYVSSINFTPQLTLAEYNALSVKPKYWIRTDGPESSTISAEDISYDNTTVKDVLDGINTNLSDKYLIIEGGYVSDLNIPIDRLTFAGIYKNNVDNNSVNKPITGNAICLTFCNGLNKNYGTQVYFSDGGLYTRTLQNSIYGTWFKIDDNTYTTVTRQVVHNNNSIGNNNIAYLRGNINTTQNDNLKTRILDAISQMDYTSDNINQLVFDIIIVGNGTFHFHGYIYNSGQYGSGILNWFGSSTACLWRRDLGTDKFYNINTTEF